MSYELKEYLNAINFTKKNLMDSDDLLWQKKYPSFIVNKILSGFISPWNTFNSSCKYLIPSYI